MEMQLVCPGRNGQVDQRRTAEKPCFHDECVGVVTGAVWLDIQCFMPDHDTGGITILHPVWCVERAKHCLYAVSYTHLTLPTIAEV